MRRACPRNVSLLTVKGRLLRTLIAAAGLGGCGGVTDPSPDVDTISLSVASLTLTPGSSQQVAVTVGSRTGGVRLTLTGLPAALTATLSPQILAQGETQSTLTVAADRAALPGVVMLTLGALSDGAGSVGTAATATAQLRVSVADCPGYAQPSSCPPFPTGGSNVISGIVAERSRAGARPISGVSVWAWVQFPNGNGYSAGRVLTDASGAYRFPNLPNALVTMQAAGTGTDQPCASVVQLEGPAATVNIEVVPQADPIVDPNPSPPALVGVVYEMTASGRQPVRGARVYFEWLFETVAATTTTDELGRYSLCRLPGNGGVTPVKTGYVTTGRSVSASGVTQLDMEMKRQ